MLFLRSLALLSALVLLTAASHGQDGGIKIEKFNHSAWTKGIFSEAVTVTGIGNAKFIYLAGVGAEDENGPRGAIRHHGNLLEQCRYAYDKIKRVLAHHGADLRSIIIAPEATILAFQLNRNKTGQRFEPQVGSYLKWEVFCVYGSLSFSDAIQESLGKDV